jgi:hypothetical protein
MKHFTPQLYQQFNSFDVDEAERADEAWDREEVAYKERLNSILPHLPSQIVKLSQLCLHDGEVLSRTEVAEPIGGIKLFGETFPYPMPFWTAVATIFVRLGDELVALLYSLVDHVRTIPAPDDWRFSKEQEQWLYDEVDIDVDDRRGPFVHRILFSTGISIEIRFANVIIQKVKLPVVTQLAKHSA